MPDRIQAVIENQPAAPRRRYMEDWHRRNPLARTVRTPKEP